MVVGPRRAAPPCAVTCAPPAPELYEYLDYRAFLADWFAWRKAGNARFSHRLFARRAGQKSPSLLLSVTAGRRNLTRTTAAAFAGAMGLDQERAEFFWNLVEFDRGRGPDREAAWARLCSHAGFRAANPHGSAPSEPPCHGEVEVERVASSG
jgi:uncharacterized protein (TIGR02147 family)